MRIRTAFAAVALAATAVMGGAGLAAAGEGPHEVHGVAVEGEFSHTAARADYLNLGGPYGITKGSIAGTHTEGEFEYAEFWAR